MPYRVRQMQPSDVFSVVRIANQAFLEMARPSWYIGKAFAQWMRRHRHCMFIAETEGGEAVGFLIGRCDGDRACIGWIAVHPSHWGRGVGGMLLSEIERCATNVGIKVVETGTPFARAFYEKYGYKCVGIRKAMVFELVGRKIEMPHGLQIRTITLDDLPKLLNVIGEENEWLQFLEAYFSACEGDPSKAAIVSEIAQQNCIGVAIGNADAVCKDLVILSYLFSAGEGRAMDVLRAFVYFISTFGHRWVGIRLPIRGISEEELEADGWQDAKLPYLWTCYEMRKEL